MKSSKKEPDYDKPSVEKRWCKEQQAKVAAYLGSQEVQHGRIGVWPAWHIAPYVSIWAIESLVQPEWIGWWAFSGDFATDYISASEVEPPQHPRKALRVVAERWLKQVEAWNAGKEYEGIRIAGPHSHQELAPLLESRAKIFIEWSGDDSMWDEGDGD